MDLFYLLLVLICSLLIVNRSIGINNFYHPSIFFIVFHVIFLYIALSYGTIFSSLLEVSNTTSNYIIFSFAIFCISTSAINSFLSKYVRKVKLSYHYSEFEDRINIMPSILLITVGLLLYIFFILKTGFISFLSNNIEADRIIARRGMGSITVLALSTLTYGGLLFITSRVPLLYKLVLGLFISIALMGFGNRGPLLTFFLLLFITFQLIKYNTIHLKKQFFFGIAIFTLFVALGVLRKNVSDGAIEIFLARFFWRPFVNIYNLQYILDAFPKSHNYLFGDGFLMDIMTLMPGHSINFQTWVKDSVGLDFEGGGVTVTYLGEFYINFGFFGLIIAPVFYSIFLNSFYYVAASFTGNRLSRFNVINLLILSYSLSPIVGSGFFPAILNSFVPFLLLIIFTRCIQIYIKTIHCYKHNTLEVIDQKY